jgi:hypothetical protein
MSVSARNSSLAADRRLEQADQTRLVQVAQSLRRALPQLFGPLDAFLEKGYESAGAVACAA